VGFWCFFTRKKSGIREDGGRKEEGGRRKEEGGREHRGRSKQREEKGERKEECIHRLREYLFRHVGLSFFCFLDQYRHFTQKFLC
jgi:hypothetical protein